MNEDLPLIEVTVEATESGDKVDQDPVVVHHKSKMRWTLKPAPGVQVKFDDTGFFTTKEPTDQLTKFVRIDDSTVELTNKCGIKQKISYSLHVQRGGQPVSIDPIIKNDPIVEP
ncbi:MAG TPA: hypothetical protein VFY73_28425 [Ideonella sp.]|uniref:hypothetical protein n=1 Tax=Ideonella sp. TaxID=1929293 RepID=UPI002E36E345|nr:hypothetical protein [Ideonella sp.]HEX5687962.1 hypothetical protein [Ideonella sp.]